MRWLLVGLLVSSCVGQSIPQQEIELQPETTLNLHEYTANLACDRIQVGRIEFMSTVPITWNDGWTTTLVLNGIRTDGAASVRSIRTGVSFPIAINNPECSGFCYYSSVIFANVDTVVGTNQLNHLVSAGQTLRVALEVCHEGNCVTSTENTVEVILRSDPDLPGCERTNSFGFPSLGSY